MPRYRSFVLAGALLALVATCARSWEVLDQICGSSGKRHHSIEPSAYVEQISNASGWEIRERRSDSGPADRPVDREK